MGPRDSFFRGVLGLRILGVLVLLTSCSNSPNVAPPVQPSPVVRDVPVETVGAQVEAGALVTDTMEPATSQETPALDGPGIIKAHCVQCHPAVWFDKIEKPRTEWEAALSLMEDMGVHLSDTEKDVLINHLAVDVRGSAAPHIP